MSYITLPARQCAPNRLRASGWHAAASLGLIVASLAMVAAYAVTLAFLAFNLR